MIAPSWAVNNGLKRVLEGNFTESEIKENNEEGYNAYYLPNCPSNYSSYANVDGSQIDKFSFIFVDFDLKSGTYKNKDEFIEAVSVSGIGPTSIVDSGNGVHVYWQVIDLDAMSYLRLTRRMMRLFNTDPAVGQIFQLMRLPGTLNTKDQNNLLKCEYIYEGLQAYTCEEMDKLLPTLTMEDEQHCRQHYDKTYNIQRKDIEITDKMPIKFAKLLSENNEVKDLWAKPSTDRSKNDWRLAHIMCGNDFTKEEAIVVLSNSAKALQRAPVHRLSYAQNIVDKIDLFEKNGTIDDDDISDSESIASILSNADSDLKGVRFVCHNKVDNTQAGFRLGQVLGLVAGSGVGKTAFALNMFRWFSKYNPNYHHFFIPLEQPKNEIAERWQTMVGSDSNLNSKVHVLSNYDNDGNFRHLSLEDIKNHIIKWKRVTGLEVGCVVIDHIGALKRQDKDAKQSTENICHNMKAFAVHTNTFLVMQSQTSRSKAGIGDVELDKDAAYGTVYFESYCDHVLTLWQPLKRCHAERGCPTVTAYKFCKIRNKKPDLDVIQEDVAYYMRFDSASGVLHPMTQDNVKSFDYFIQKATEKRGQDQKTKLTEYKTVGDDEQQTATYHS